MLTTLVFSLLIPLTLATKASAAITISELDSNAWLSSTGSNFTSSSLNSTYSQNGWSSLSLSGLSFDDSSKQVSFPTGFYTIFNGSAYDSVYIGSNTYMTFGGGSSVYSSLSVSNPALPGLHLCAADNSYQLLLIKYENSNERIRIRYEGTASTGGTLGTPNIVYEAVFYKNSSVIDIAFGSNSRCPNGTLFATSGSSKLSDFPVTNVANKYIRISSAPSVTFFRSDAQSPNNTTANLSYAIIMSESVNGIESTDFENAGTAINCSFTPSATSGTSFSVSVRDCSEGTVLPRIKAFSFMGSTSGPASAVEAATTIILDRTPPTISSIAGPANSIYGPGGDLDFSVSFSESVTVTGNPRIPITVGETNRYASFSGLSDSKTAIFRYTVQTDADDIDVDGVEVTSLAELNGGSIDDLATNSMSNFSFSPPALPGVRIAQAASSPTINSITAGDRSLSISFTAGASNGGEISNYQYSEDGGATFSNFSPADTTTPLIITGLTNGAPVQVRIRAVTSLNGILTPGDSSNAVTGTPAAVPINTSPPAITGTIQVGQQLRVNEGSWTNSPTSYGYTWLRSQNENGPYEVIPGEIANGYTIRAGDNSYFFKVVVEGINLQGSTFETSSATNRVTVPISISGGSNITKFLGDIESSTAFTASGGYGNIELSVTPVDSSISITNGVVVAGADLAVGSYTETIMATDSLGDTASTTMSITVLQGQVNAPDFTVSKGTTPGSFKLNFSPVTGAASYTVKVYRSNDSFTYPNATITNYSSGDEIYDGDPRTCSTSFTPICYGIIVGNTFKFTITPIAASGYTSGGEGAKSSKYGIYEPTRPSITVPTSGAEGLDIQNYGSSNSGMSGLVAYAYSYRDNFTSIYDTMSILGTGLNRFELPGGDTFTVTFKYLGATVGDTTWFDSDESLQPTARFVLNKPNAPSNVSASRSGSGSISVTWTLASGPYQTYYYYTSTDGVNFTYKGYTTTASASIAGLTNGTAYYVRVFVRGTGTYNRNSDYVLASSTITPAGVPGPVSTSGSVAGDQSVRLTWTPPADDGGSEITGYLIEYSAGIASYGASVAVLSTDTSVVISGLTNGSTYYFRIKAVNVAGEGTAVEFGGGSGILVQGTAESIVGAVTSITGTTATISATINARGNTTTPTLRWGLAGETQTDVTLSAVTSDNVVVTSNLTGLLPGRRYQVTSTTSPGVSQDVGGRPIYFTTTPNAIATATSVTSNSSITVSWAYDAGGSGYSFNYDVTATLNGVSVGSGCDDVTAASGGLHSCEFTGLTANSSYVISITKTITGGDYGNGTSSPYTLTVSTDPNIATITLTINGGNLTLQRGSTINIVAATNVAGRVTFRLNGRAIKNCKQKSTVSLSVTCSWLPSVHGPAQLSALFNPTSNLYTNVTTRPTAVTVVRRTGSRS